MLSEEVLLVMLAAMHICEEQAQELGSEVDTMEIVISNSQVQVSCGNAFVEASRA